jgi:hypothetical protein
MAARHPVASAAGAHAMTDEEKREISQFVTDAQALTLNAVSQSLAVVVARLAWHVDAHEKLRTDLREFLRDFKPDKPEDQTSVMMHSMMSVVLRQMLLRLSEIPDLENPQND